MNWLGSLDESDEGDSNNDLEESIPKKLPVLQNTEALKQKSPESTENSFELPPPIMRHYKSNTRKSFVNRMVDDFLKREQAEKGTPKLLTNESKTCTKRSASTPFPIYSNNQAALEESLIQSPIHNSIRRLTNHDHNTDPKSCSTRSQDKAITEQSLHQSLTAGKKSIPDAKTAKKTGQGQLKNISAARSSSSLVKKPVKRINKSAKLSTSRKTAKPLSMKRRKTICSTMDNILFKNKPREYTALNPDKRRTFVENAHVSLNDKAFDLDEEWTTGDVLPIVEAGTYYFDDFKFLMDSLPIRGKSNKVNIIDNIQIRSPQMRLTQPISTKSTSTMQNNKRTAVTALSTKGKVNKKRSNAGNKFKVSSNNRGGNSENESPNAAEAHSTNISRSNYPKKVLQVRNKSTSKQKSKDDQIDGIFKLDANDKSQTNEPYVLLQRVTENLNTDEVQEPQLYNVSPSKKRKENVSKSQVLIKTSLKKSEEDVRDKAKRNNTPIKLTSTGISTKTKAPGPQKKLELEFSQSSVNSSVRTPMNKIGISNNSKDLDNNANKTPTPSSESEFQFIKPKLPRGRPKKGRPAIVQDKSETQSQIQVDADESSNINSTPTPEVEFKKPSTRSTRGRPKTRDPVVQDKTESSQIQVDADEGSNINSTPTPEAEFIKPATRSTRGKSSIINLTPAPEVEFTKPLTRSTRGKPKAIIDPVVQDKIERSQIQGSQIEVEFKKPSTSSSRGRPTTRDPIVQDKRKTQETSSGTRNKKVEVTKANAKTRKSKFTDMTPVQDQCITTSDSDIGALSRNSVINNTQSSENITSSTINRTARNRTGPAILNKWMSHSDVVQNSKKSDAKKSRTSLKPNVKRLKSIPKEKRKNVPKNVSKNASSRKHDLATILEESQLLRERYSINMELENAMDAEEGSTSASSSVASVRRVSQDLDSLDSNSALATTSSSVYVAKENAYKRFLFSLPSTSDDSNNEFITQPLPRDCAVKVGQIKIKPGLRKPNVTLRNHNLTIFVHSGTGIYQLQNQSARLKKEIFVRAYDGTEYAIVNDGKKDLKLVYVTYPSGK